jgi:hypothetical protein
LPALAPAVPFGVVGVVAVVPVEVGVGVDVVTVLVVVVAVVVVVVWPARPNTASVDNPVFG